LSNPFSNRTPLDIAAPGVPLCAPGDDCAILFARAPIPGRVKSRLGNRLTPEQACALHCAATSDTAALLAETLPDAAVWVFFSEDPGNWEASGMILPPRFRCALQEGNSLGDRMGAAFARAFASGARRVVIFGSDSPTLPPPIPGQAFRALADCDLVVGPAEDGGYYLIGCRRFDPRLFQEVEWSTPRACEQTLANAARLDYTTTLLERWFDLDEWRDVERLMADARRGISLPPHLAEFFQGLGLSKELDRNAPAK
jgi:rSAM/selenodomain-associated transferase 1